MLCSTAYILDTYLRTRQPSFFVFLTCSSQRWGLEGLSHLVIFRVYIVECE